MTMVYQAKAGDGFTKRGMKRTNSFFNTPKEAISEAIALKKKMDVRYKNEIQWDYNGEVTGSSSKMNILRGYLGGDRESKPFYLQIVSVDSKKDVDTVSPFKVKKMTTKDKNIINKVLQLFK